MAMTPASPGVLPRTVHIPVAQCDDVKITHEPEPLRVLLGGLLAKSVGRKRPTSGGFRRAAVRHHQIAPPSTC